MRQQKESNKKNEVKIIKMKYYNPPYIHMYEASKMRKNILLQSEVTKKEEKLK